MMTELAGLCLVCPGPGRGRAVFLPGLLFVVTKFQPVCRNFENFGRDTQIGAGRLMGVALPVGNSRLADSHILGQLQLRHGGPFPGLF